MKRKDQSVLEPITVTDTAPNTQNPPTRTLQVCEVCGCGPHPNQAVCREGWLGLPKAARGATGRTAWRAGFLGNRQAACL